MHLCVCLRASKVVGLLCYSFRCFFVCQRHTHTQHTYALSHSHLTVIGLHSVLRRNSSALDAADPELKPKPKPNCALCKALFVCFLFVNTEIETQLHQIRKNTLQFHICRNQLHDNSNNNNGQQRTTKKPIATTTKTNFKSVQLEKWKPIQTILSYSILMY